MPGFTMGYKYSGIEDLRLASMFIDQLTLKFSKNSFASIEMNNKGTGKFESTLSIETIEDSFDAIELSLPDDVEGATAQQKLDNIHSIDVLDPVSGAWLPVTVISVSGNPEVITITAPGGTSNLTTYKVKYVPEKPSWTNFVTLAAPSIPPLRVSCMDLNIGGKWNGTQFIGGRLFNRDIAELTYELQNNILIEFRINGTGQGCSDNQFANHAKRQNRMQTITLDKDMNDAIIRVMMREQGLTFGVKIDLEGPEFESGNKYWVTLVFPKCGLTGHKVGETDKVLSENATIQIMEDADYGSVIATVVNQFPGYLQEA
jgi:hypothetical protein